MQVLVTGGSGFIGSEVIRQLARHGLKVRALLRSSSSRRFLEGVDYEGCLGDVTDYASLKAAVKGVDVVVHLAGIVSARNKSSYFLHNTQGTSFLAKAVAEVNPGLKRFVHVSSLAASGPAQSLKPKTEEDPEHPISAYGESKLGGERELMRWAKEYPTTIVRPPAVYGPRDRGVFEFIKIVNGGIIPVFPARTEDREKYFSLIHVEDLVHGIAQCVIEKRSERSQHEVFFLSGDGIHSWSGIMGSIAKVLGKKAIRVKLPGFALTGIAAGYTALGYMFNKQFPLTLDKLNELRPDYWICSNEQAKLNLGFQPKYDLEAGLQSAVRWYRENAWLS